MTPTTLVNMHRTHSRREYDIRIDRASPLWGNPYEIGVDGTRADCIRQYEIDTLNDPRRMGRLWTLVGKRLACWCATVPCHGDVLVRLVAPGLC